MAASEEHSPHGGVAVGPVAKYAKALELGRLGLDPAEGRVGRGGGPELQLSETFALGPPLGAKGLLDLPLDGKAMAVPARNIIDVVAEREARADDEILQELVEGMADMDRPIGVGRPIVEYEQRRTSALASAADVVVEAFPSVQDPRL